MGSSMLLLKPASTATAHGEHMAIDSIVLPGLFLCRPNNSCCRTHCSFSFHGITLYPHGQCRLRQCNRKAHLVRGWLRFDIRLVRPSFQNVEGDP